MFSQLGNDRSHGGYRVEHNEGEAQSLLAEYYPVISYSD
jgi:hypothetical protein